MEFNDWLATLGLDPATLTPQARTALQAQWRAEQKPNDPPKPPADDKPVAGDTSIAEINRAAKAEKERRDAITAAVQQAVQLDPDNYAEYTDLGEKAVAKGWDVAAASMAIENKRLHNQVKSRRPNHINLTAPTAPEVTAAVLEAAICQAGKLGNVNEAFDERTNQIAHSRFRGGIGLTEFIGICAESRGWRGNAGRDLRRAMKVAFREPDDQGPRAEITASTLDVAGILSNVANKFVKEAWMFVEDVWEKITAKRSVKDFKQISSYSLTGDLTYREVAPGGELKHGTLGDETYNNQAKTYGIVLGIDRRDLINDDLNAFSSIGKRLGRGGKLKLLNVFWTTFMNNSTFFTSARGNYDDGTDTALTNDGLVAADIIWSAMTDPDGQPMAGDPKYLLVPPALRIPAWRLLNSQQFTAADEEGSGNPWAGRWELLSSVYLSNSAYTGYSTKAWYWLRDPNDMPVIETCFLNGQEMPTVETVEMATDHLGMAMRAYHDFGVALQEYRGGFKAKGEA